MEHQSKWKNVCPDCFDTNSIIKPNQARPTCTDIPEKSVQGSYAPIDSLQKAIGKNGNQKIFDVLQFPDTDTFTIYFYRGMLMGTHLLPRFLSISDDFSSKRLQKGWPRLGLHHQKPPMPRLTSGRHDVTCLWLSMSQMVSLVEEAAHKTS